MTPPTLLAAREGFVAPGVGSFYWPSIIELRLFGVDVSINRTALIVFLGTTLLIAFFVLGSRKAALVPRGLQNAMEYGIDFVRNQIVLPVMGQKGLAYLPYLTTLFFFIFALNLFEVIPGINFPPTSRIAIPLFLAFITYLMFIYAGVKAQGFGHYFREIMFPPGVPIPVLLILTPIEFFSTLIVRPLSLAIRLVANMIAGHLMLGVFFLGTAYLLDRQLTIGFGVLSLGMSVALVGFEIFVAGLQAFIFTILTAVYIAGSLEPAH